MKTYTDSERLSWLTIKNPEIEFDDVSAREQKSSYFWLRLWINSDYKVFYAETRNSVIDKAMHYCEVIELIDDQYFEHFTITFGKGDNESTFAFKYPVHVEELSVIQDAYWDSCKNNGVCLHEKREHEKYMQLFIDGVINKDALDKLKQKGINIPESFDEKNDFLDLLQSFIMSENDFCYLDRVNVPDDVLEHLPSLNKPEYAPRNVTLGW